MDKVTKVKIISGMLATQGSHAVQGIGGVCHRCRLCGKAENGGETNFHVLWECPGGRNGGQVWVARNKMVQKLNDMVGKLNLGDDEHVVMAAVRHLQGGTGVWEEVEQMLTMFGNGAVDAGLAEMLAVAVRGAGGAAMKLARRGLIGGGWVHMLEGLGTRRDVAVKLVSKMSGATLDGGVAIWKAFMGEVRGASDGGEEGDPEDGEPVR